MTLEEIRSLLREQVEVAGSQTAWSKERGVALSYVNAVLAKRYEPGEKLLTAMGYRKVVSYEPIDS